MKTHSGEKPNETYNGEKQNKNTQWRKIGIELPIRPEWVKEKQIVGQGFPAGNPLRFDRGIVKDIGLDAGFYEAKTGEGSYKFELQMMSRQTQRKEPIQLQGKQARSLVANIQQCVGHFRSCLVKKFSTFWIWTSVPLGTKTAQTITKVDK